VLEPAVDPAAPQPAPLPVFWPEFLPCPKRRQLRAPALTQAERAMLPERRKSRRIGSRPGAEQKRLRTAALAADAAAQRQRRRIGSGSSVQTCKLRVCRGRRSLSVLLDQVAALQEAEQAPSVEFKLQEDLPSFRAIIPLRELVPLHGPPLLYILPAAVLPELPPLVLAVPSTRRGVKRRRRRSSDERAAASAAATAAAVSAAASAFAASN